MTSNEIRLELRGLQAQTMQAVEQFDNSLGELLWVQVQRLIGEGFEHAEKSDEHFARKEWYKWAFHRCAAEMRLALGRDLMKIAEERPRLADSVKAVSL
jgi:hypothetical protein